MDKFLLFSVSRFGTESWHIIKKNILKDPLLSENPTYRTKSEDYLRLRYYYVLKHYARQFHIKVQALYYSTAVEPYDFERDFKASVRSSVLLTAEESRLRSPEQDLLDCIDKGYGVGRVCITVDMFQDINLDQDPESSDDSKDEKFKGLDDSDDNLNSGKYNLRKKSKKKKQAKSKKLPEIDDNDEESWDQRDPHDGPPRKNRKKAASKAQEPKPAAVEPKKQKVVTQSKLDYFLKPTPGNSQNTHSQGVAADHPLDEEVIEHLSENRDEEMEELQDHHLTKMLEQDSDFDDNDLDNDSDDMPFPVHG